MLPHLLVTSLITHAKQDTTSSGNQEFDLFYLSSGFHHYASLLEVLNSSHAGSSLVIYAKCTTQTQGTGGQLMVAIYWHIHIVLKLSPLINSLVIHAPVLIKSNGHGIR